MGGLHPSPIVLSYVPSECVRLIKEFRIVESLPKTSGRDPNAMLTDLFDTPIRPDWVDNSLNAIAESIDQDDHETARAELNELREKLGSDDRKIIRLGAMLDFMSD